MTIASFGPLSFNDITRIFTIDYETDLDFSGLTSKSYTIVVTGTAGNVTPTSDSNSFDLTVKNPCIDPNFVTITAPTMAALTYTISSDPAKFASHSAFTISTLPIPHTLCGNIAYSATFDGTAVNDDPLDYDPVTRKFTADSDDQSLIGLTKPYAVNATLSDYPPSTYKSATSVAASSTINFVDPCLDPFTFESTT